MRCFIMPGYGMYQYYQQTGDETMRDIIDNWFAERFAEGATTKDVNTMAPFLTLAYRYEETRNPAYLRWLDSWAEWAMHDMPRTKFGGMQHISPEGELLHTSFGTGMGHNLDFYRNIPRTSMPYGQAMAILCLTEYLRKYF